MFITVNLVTGESLEGVILQEDENFIILGWKHEKKVSYLAKSIIKNMGC